MYCNVAKVRRGTNAVRSKSQGRRNVTAQQLLSLFFAFYCIDMLIVVRGSGRPNQFLLVMDYDWLVMIKGDHWDLSFFHFDSFIIFLDC